jgi:hypothetical protein
MSELRHRMIRDMTVRGFSPRTHEAYIAAVVKRAKYDQRAPDQLTDDEVQAYVAHLIQDRKLSWSTCSQAAHAFRFLYHVHPRSRSRAVPRPRPQAAPDAPRDPQPGGGLAPAQRLPARPRSPSAGHHLRRRPARERGGAPQGRRPRRRPQGQRRRGPRPWLRWKYRTVELT